MNALEFLKSRRSTRSFSTKEVSRELILEILECAILAPTARNIQPWHFVVITKKETLNELALLSDNGRFIADSPTCIAVFCEETKYYLEDGCNATMNILTAAHILGLGACWVAGDKKDYTESVKKLLSVPKNYNLVSLIPLGYFDEEPRLPSKKSLNDLAHWEKW